MTTATKSTHHVSARVAGIRFLFSTHTLQTALDTVLFDHYRKKLLSGSVVNASEQRAAWHTEFRNPQPCQLVQDSLAQIKQISDSIRQHQWFFDVKDIVNIGIGGSDLGPKLICEAFEDEITQFTLHFVSNLDKAQIHSTLKKLSPAQTLFIVTSKSFRTTETIENMLIAKQWLLEAGCDPAEHLIAVTTNIHIATEIYQIPVSRVLMMPDWIGGRFSLWCAVGLPCAIALGFEKFSELHQGAYEMDMHFLQTSSEKNAPVMYASLLPFFLTILPFMSSPAFKYMVFGAKSQKMFYMIWPVSGAEGLFPYLLLFILLLLFTSRFVPTSKIWKSFLIYFLILFSVTHYHPQWFLWLSPFLIIELVQSKLKNIYLILGLLLCYLAIVVTFDRSLSSNLLAVTFPDIEKFAGIDKLLSSKIDLNQFRSSLRSIFAGITLFLSYDLLRKKSEV